MSETVACFELHTSGFLVSSEQRVKPLPVKSTVLKKLIYAFSVVSLVTALYHISFTNK
ncbi:hypothetical protein [Halalkalibacter hemicellulosilyticus]|uniref:Uncharacterized protein n=1 Tax=Halalkalibacter hemicellulosilyticusJCM 9152 TaxID=1236971 RepID=W4QJ43_9BACI|nr:hypothetical protein [Halalkalibacter hemicellulosilyticus]GAE31907.1 hypothetical protein JCM9152_3403 [Halalkalibacter hemicellulosilyticusJCM 9152]